MKKCPECNSDKIVKNVIVIDRGDHNSTHFLRVAVDEEPDALIFKHRSYSDVRAEVCAFCGYVGFYAENPQILWTAYQKQGNKL
ncbi:MAG: hypothetical protein JSS81_22335 [Acidobacteria bacterium]|nr:hypothetical protein [Acidobacteriota bacterium]